MQPETNVPTRASSGRAYKIIGGIIVVAVLIGAVFFIINVLSKNKGIDQNMPSAETVQRESLGRQVEQLPATSPDTDPDARKRLNDVMKN